MILEADISEGDKRKIAGETIRRIIGESGS